MSAAPPPPPPGGGWSQQPAGGQPGPKPSNNLVWGILTTIFCCLPLGIVSIVHAAGVDSAYNGGNYAEAQRKADLAKKWAIAAAAAGLAIVVVWVLLVVLGIGGAMMGA